MTGAGTVIRLPHLPSHAVHATLFNDVKNSTFLRQQLVDQNAKFEYAFLDPSAILSINHVLAAVFRAINAMLNGRLKSRNVHAEIVFSLSPNNNIAESFRRFGVTDQTSNLLAIKVFSASEASASLSTAASNISKHLIDSVDGSLVDFTNANIAVMSDLLKIKNIYKLPVDSKPTASTQVNGLTPDEDQFRQMEAMILGTMAVKGS